MVKIWYPVVDIGSCKECGACVSKCTHGVYNKEKAPVPVVINPDNCVYQCHGCGKLCPQGAITYVGDDTGWIPPAWKDKEADSSKGCCCCRK